MLLKSLRNGKKGIPMKRMIRTLTLAALAACLLTVSALADSGPKDLLTVKVANAPEGLYYLDILEPDMAGADPCGNNRREDEDQPLDPALTETLLSAVPEGWHACTLDHTNGAPIWGDLLGQEAGDLRLHTFSYAGVPDTYRLILAPEGGEPWVSDVLERTVLQSSVTVDYAAKTVTVPPVWRAYAVQLLTTLTTTLVLEGIVLALFGFGKQKRNWLVFFLVNLVTQSGLAVWTAHTFLCHGVSGWSVLTLLPAELVIFPAEMIAYSLLLRGQPRSRAAACGFLANLFSAVLGIFAVEPVWRLIQSIL